MRTIERGEKQTLCLLLWVQWSFSNNFTQITREYMVFTFKILIVETLKYNLKTDTFAWTDKIKTEDETKMREVLYDSITSPHVYFFRPRIKEERQIYCIRFKAVWHRMSETLNPNPYGVILVTRHFSACMSVCPSVCQMVCPSVSVTLLCWLGLAKVKSVPCRTCV